MDKRDIDDSDFILVNIQKVVSVGTDMEIMYAFIKQKPIIVFTNLTPQDLSPWVIYHSTKIIYDKDIPIALDNACKYVKEVF